MDSQTSNQEQHQYLTFRLRDEEFGVGILQVKEILEYGTLTRVPMVPNFIRGVINLRGSVVPVIDLGARFQMAPGEVGNRTCVVIVEVERENELGTMGLMVDAVSEVVEIAARDIEPPPPFGAGIRLDFIRGMAKMERKFVMLLDIEKILSDGELAVIQTLGTGKSQDRSNTAEVLSVS